MDLHFLDQRVTDFFSTNFPYFAYDRKVYDNIIELWKAQDGKCAITHLPMTLISNDLCAATVSRISDQGLPHFDNLQWVCQFVASAQGLRNSHEIEDALLRYKNFRCAIQQNIETHNILLDHLTSILRRGGFALVSVSSYEWTILKCLTTHSDSANSRGQVQINKFLSLEVIIIGRLVVDTNPLQIGLTRKGRTLTVDLADPNYHLTILKFLGLTDHELMILMHNHTFDDLI